MARNEARAQERDDGFTPVTKGGRPTRPVDYLIADPTFGQMMIDEPNYYAALLRLTDMENALGKEVGLVGAALGGGFENTAELKPMKYDEAMETPDAEGWKIAVKEEYD
jgi:hypothetical protein